MPYKIALENDVLRIALTGRVTPRDLAELAAEAKNYEEDVENVPHRVTDMTGIDEVAIHYPDISTFADKRRQLRFPNSFKSAIIAKDVHHVGYARMFQTLNDNPQINIRIFQDEASAGDWIAFPGAFGRG